MDAITNLDSSLKEYNCPSTEDELSWKVETNVNKDTGVDAQFDDNICWDSHNIVKIENQTEQSRNKQVLIRSAFSNDFRKIWNELNNGEFNDIQRELEKIKDWDITSDDKNIKERDIEIDSNSNVINVNGMSHRRQNAELYDKEDASSRKSEKPKHKRDNKNETKAVK